MMRWLFEPLRMSTMRGILIGLVLLAFVPGIIEVSALHWRGRKLLTIACLVLAVMFWIAAAIRTHRRWHHAQRVIAGLCPGCGYDLRASKDRCPECGRASARWIRIRYCAKFANGRARSSEAA